MRFTNYMNKLFTGYKDRKMIKELISIVNDGKAIFTDFGDDVYMSDFVNNCIDRIATEISKIQVISVVNKTSSNVIQQNDDITRLFKFKPNELQTTKDFLSNCEWLRRKTCNCFIYPQYRVIKDTTGRKFKKYIAMYPLNPEEVELGMIDNKLWAIKFYWKDGSHDTLPYKDIIHLKWRRGKNTIIGGGDDDGQPSSDNLLNSVKILDQVLQGLPKTIEASLKVTGIFNAKSLMDSKKLDSAREDFENRIFSSKTGIIATDLGGEFTPVNLRTAKIDDTTLKFLKSIIRDRYGISEAIVSGDYNGEQHSAFYQSCIEDFIVEFQQAMSSGLFTKRELDVGHEIKCYYNKVSYLSTQNKIEIANLATNTGMLMLNEINEMFGIPPFEGGNRRLQSLNYVNTKLVDKYQLDKAGVKNNEKQG